MEHFDPKLLATLGIEKVATTLMDIGVDELFPGQWQKRKYFDEKSQTELDGSMRSAGTNVVPIIAVPRSTGHGYSIIAGERRWRSAQRIGLRQVKCEVGNYTYQQALFISAIENLQRSDLNPIEEATSYQELENEFGISHDLIARQIGKSRAHISNYLRLLKLDITVRDALIHKKLTFGQARPLCSLPLKSDQRAIAKRAIRLEWSVLQIQNAVYEITKKAPEPVKLSDQDADLRRLEREISEVTGISCIVRRTPKGNWELGFIAQGTEIFSGLLERLGIEIDADLEN